MIELAEEATKNDGKDTLKHATSQLVLVPQPSDNPADPLNWPMSKKVLTLGLVSLSSFIGITQALANQSGFFAQARVYQKSATELSYSVRLPAVGIQRQSLHSELIEDSGGKDLCCTRRPRIRPFPMDLFVSAHRAFLLHLLGITVHVRVWHLVCLYDRS